MKKILSIFLSVLMLCQCFTAIGVLASDDVEAPTKLLISVKPETTMAWYPGKTEAPNGPVCYLYTDTSDGLVKKPVND